MPQESIHEEIKWLESQLEAKKREAAGGSEAKPERQIVREIIKEAAVVPFHLPVGGAISDDAAQKAAYDLKEKEHAHIIEELIALALAKGLASAMKVANSLKNPHLLDEFHDTLADKYYEKLLEARKLK
ncbi:hypothetical protein A2926_03605 [Candidatus Giovannonibacteria bacterium RIFCSPLOWO2_01_FULL_44_40]|uniref:Uncharacterized protein n=1 Tax=Candidatus Giovannonibacteria bacterium RIFCSPHIGHO2_01_FULL_45_23 TaxID=1798325 RepID=A0A1F5VIM0_9BACT|nr:MAG: hypothetical protein A2834_04020 [Candidatus Giovannonibacteria bacterium RIFCSPHIGHO2_01_FULL_45_23]OGF75787.1 MAG: hypothetical protein A3C77_04345 [Candidatus Giovannonibacteria bacterium RIFCSPHIGHO2_02_FULL_45_13]OGF79627.1 MAG: hypothetical protein A2926_03605 [Candidatus Giovannonibacteria bacterium RIFCSPLOWO2_01_FULL_44_40]